MDTKYVIKSLDKNLKVFLSLLNGVKKEEYLFKPDTEHWCLLEIICHLVDEEREDFRIRLQTVLEAPFKHPPIIDPEGWVMSRKYLDQNFKEKIKAFRKERKASIQYLSTLENPKWINYYEHPILGNLDGHHFLRNWLAHDYLHIRQITRVRYRYLQYMTASDCSYAGNW